MTTQPPEPPSDQTNDIGNPPPAEPPPSYSTPPAPSPSGGGARPGELVDRFLARLIDGILLGVVSYILVTLLVIRAFMNGTGGGFMMSTGSTFAVSAVAAILGVAIQMGYFTYMESSRGQTVGKMLLKLQTLGPDGGNPSVEEAAKRNIFYAFGLIGIVPVLGIVGSLISLVAVIMIAVNINADTSARQGWHDRFAGGTRVVKLS